MATIEVNLKHVVIAALIALAITVGGGYGYLKYRLELANAEFAEKSYNADRKSWEEDRSKHEEERSQWSTQQAELTKEIDSRKQEYAKSIAAATKPKSVEEVKKDAETVLKTTPDITPDDKLAFDAPSVQLFVAEKLSHEQCEADKTDLKKLFDAEAQKTTSLTTDLVGAKKQIAESEDVAAKYKSVAKKSGFRKFIGGVAKYGLPVIAAYGGYRLGQGK